MTIEQLNQRWLAQCVARGITPPIHFPVVNVCIGPHLPIYPLALDAPAS